MIGFRGISDSPQASESAEESHGPTKEAQEATNLRLYERALREQRAGCEEEARATFAELLAQPLLAEVDVEDAAHESRADSAPLLKYLCFKNMAVLATKREEWTAAVDYFAKAVSIDSTDVVVWYRMGVAAYAGQHLSVARYALEQGLGINPQHWLSAKLLVKVLSAMGNLVASDTLGRYVRSADPTYHVGQAIDTRDALGGSAPGAERQCNSTDESERSVCATKQHVKLEGANASWPDFAQQLVALAEQSVRQGETDGFRRALDVQIVTAEPTNDTQSDAVADRHPATGVQVTEAASGKTSPEKVASAELENDMDVERVEDSQDTPGSSPRKSERKKRMNHRLADEQDGQELAGDALSKCAENKHIERATLRLAKFIDSAPDGVVDKLVLSTTSRAPEDAEISATAPAAPSLREFVASLQRENHSLLSVIRMVLAELCSDVQRLLPKAIVPEILRLHSILTKHSSVGLCQPCNVFLAELYFSTYKATSDDKIKGRMLRECRDLVSSINYDNLGPGSRHSSETARLQARLCWLRGRIAESTQDSLTAHACFVSCSRWIQHSGIAQIVIANTVSDNLISAGALQHKLCTLDENEHTERISQLFATGQHDEFASEIAPRLEKKKTQSTPEQWCTLLNQLLVSSEKTRRWDLLLQCHIFRLQHALSTQCTATCCQILCGSDISVQAGGNSAVSHEVLKLLASLQHCANMRDNTWCSSNRATELLSLVARGLEKLELQTLSSTAIQPLLVAWECFARLWVLRNAHDVPKSDLIAKCAAHSSLAREIKRACDLDNQTVVGTGDVMTRQSLVRVLAVGLLKLLHAANEGGLLAEGINEDDRQETLETDAAEMYYDARELLDWCLFDLHGIEFPEATGSQQHRQKKDRDLAIHISPGMEAEEAFYWYWYAGQHDFTTVLGKYAKKWKDLQLQFIDLVQKASKNSFPHNDAVDSQIDATILGTHASHDPGSVRDVELTGTSRIHLILHHEHATVKHSYMNQTFFEDNNIDQPTRRGKIWGRNWDKELRELAILYRRDLSVNPTRADSWQSLGQCYFRLLDNLLDQHTMGNVDADADQSQPASTIFCGSAIEYNERARNCFLRALELDPSSHEPLDLLGFLAFMQIRHGYRQESIVSEAVDRFAKADAVAQQNNAGADEWMYPFMLGKLRELQGAPPSTWMPLYWTAKRRHKVMCDKTDKAELIYRLHASRLKAALALNEDDEESWRLLLRQKSNSAVADDTISLQKNLIERRKIVVDSAVSKLLGLLKKGERNAWGLEGMKWFYKSRYAVASAFLQLGEPKKAARHLSALFDTEKERARHFWKMHTYKLTDFGDFSFITERHYDRWRMKCLYLYVHLLVVLEDKCSAGARERCADAEKALLLAQQRRDKAESSSSKLRWQQDVTKAQADFDAARRDVERGQLLKLERALKRGNDKRVMNSRWTEEGRHVAMAARYIVLVEKTDKLEDSDDKSGVPEVIANICDAVVHDAESGGRSVMFAAELKRADKWLRDVYELYCGMRTYTVDTARVPPPPPAASELRLTAASSDETCISSTDVCPARCFSDLLVSRPPALENLSAKRNCLHCFSGRGLEIRDFSEPKVLNLLRRRFSRFIAAAPESAPVPPEVILSYCEKTFGKAPLDDKEVPLSGIVLVHSHIKACAEASAAAAEQLRRDRAAKAQLEAARAARIEADAKQSASLLAKQPGSTIATALRTAPSAARTCGDLSPTGKRKRASTPKTVNFEDTLRAYLHEKKTDREPAAQRQRLAK